MPTIINHGCHNFRCRVCFLRLFDRDESDSTLTATESATATTEIEKTTTKTAESQTTTTGLSSEATIGTETSTVTSEAEVSTTNTEGATTTTAENETSQTTIGSETTTAVAITESSTIVSETTTATTTTAEEEPTYLTNLDFEDGTTAPWIVAPYSNLFSLSAQSQEGAASGRQLFGTANGPGSEYRNYFYQRLDKRLLTAGHYSLKGYARVDRLIDDDSNYGCSSVSANCLVGPPDNLQNLPGQGLSLSANGFYPDWNLINSGCTFTEEVLAQNDQFGIAFGFTCLGTGVNVDTVSFGPA
ncbi:hypothetical protein LB504_003762 [Fusarium proliferatum]|nr:hypothetical protein LB504_003762 [Fusarium proliferatum]